ncbi:23S rRNA pseudouridine1911/1915/1917 synthase [Lewinella marina]|uniref:RNA pseudouridine synthase n=1 Tax=Neolewinella marina TaxID=438751 RepID=A0A2G0CC91_9BACT|nr:RluA family pseudouridine synthase [Neolewinella marina]NJB87714.1 23S rRNA pseudouridine1911/1915/1917 synthase [Neolewinella marina]PHK97609.1 RNA pseudouridine synthase [Neolewinella marina]
MLDILLEGPAWAVINKPAGIATERHFQYDTVEARAQEQWSRPNAKKPAFVGIVHRLDRVTSGALVLARNKSTLVTLNEAFAARQATKVYWAVTDRPLPETAGHLKHYLVRNPTNKLAMASTRPVPGGQEATLEYHLLIEQGERYLYELRPRTGRFHQIRCQLAASGAPIVGDHAYGSHRPLGDHQIALHARVLGFPDPKTGETVTVTAPLPAHWPLHPPRSEEE